MLLCYEFCRVVARSCNDPSLGDRLLAMTRSAASAEAIPQAWTKILSVQEEYQLAEFENIRDTVDLVTSWLVIPTLCALFPELKRASERIDFLQL
jgi:hypothetical protein